MFIYICMHMYNTCIRVYIHIYRERERETMHAYAL